MRWMILFAPLAGCGAPHPPQPVPASDAAVCVEHDRPCDAPADCCSGECVVPDPERYCTREEPGGALHCTTLCR